MSDAGSSRAGDVSSNATRISVLIPEGCLKIAQRFNVGFNVGTATSPEGTANFAVPLCQPSLRHWPSLGFMRVSMTVRV